MRAFVSFAANLCAFALLGGLTPTAHAEDQPNILFIFLDDFGWKDTSYMGSDFYETPHLDALASEGMIFTDAYSCAANCAPARASLLSGQYTPRHQIFNVGTKPRGATKHRRLEHIAGVDTLDTGIQTWAAQLQAAGYATGTFGKWHLSKDPKPYGFDVNIGGGHSGSPPRGYYPPHPGVPGLDNASKDEYLTDRITDEAIEFIRKSNEKPWLVYLTHFAVHTPLDAKRELLQKYQEKEKGTLHDHAVMATMIQAVDDGVGRIRSTLQELGIEEDTVVLFFSDNGGYGPATDMAPLKGYKGTYYEGGIRVPFFARWPGRIPAGAVSHEPIIGVDLFPTLLALAGAPKPSQILDGVNLLPLLTGEVDSLGDRPLFWHFPAYLQAYAVTDEQRDPLFRSRPCGAIRWGDWKLIEYFEDQHIELFHLTDDIGESTNRADAEPETTKKLLQRLEQWRSEIQAATPTRPNPEFDADAETAAIARIHRRQ